MVPPDEIKQGFRGSRPRLRGDAHLKPRAPAVPAAEPAPKLSRPEKKRVLFVCIGNSCRSQMAEAFARAYGSDVLTAQSAGLSPAAMIAPLTRQVLAERNVQVGEQFPKPLEFVTRQPLDLIVNMSGQPLRLPNVRVVDWQVRDPIGESENVYRAVSQQIEGLVMSLILNLRSGRMG